jgi:hypothetical protein
MNILKEYKTFDNKTGEIKIDCKLYYDEHRVLYSVVVNDKTVLVVTDFKCANVYYGELLEMDKYISSKVRSYEVYELIK